MARSYDAIIIGTGQSGPSLAARMSAEGQKVAIIERFRFGGTCVNSGCTPTKTLVASARIAQQARRAGEYGISVGGPIEVDMLAVKDRMREVSGAQREGLERWIKGLPRIDVYEGHGMFTGPKAVRVKDEDLSAPTIVINVGTRAKVPDFPGALLENVVTNSSLIASNDLPSHLVVLGAGYVGLEFAQMYRRFGSDVTVITHSADLAGHEDLDVQAAIREILEGEGVVFKFNTNIKEVQRSYGELTISTDGYYGEEVLTATHLLVAVGREPNTHDLGLDFAGVAVDGRGFVKVDAKLATNVPGIYAIGDVNGRGAFTHTSYNDYEILAANLFDGARRSVEDRIMCYALFIDPPLGRAGLTEREALARGHRVLCGKRAMSRVSRAQEFGETQGFIKVLVDADTEKILGAAILGLYGDEAVHSLLDVMYTGASYKTLQRAMHIHPTVTELIPTVLGELKPLEESSKM